MKRGHYVSIASIIVAIGLLGAGALAIVAIPVCRHRQSRPQ